MKKELSSLDIHYVLEELSFLVGARVDSIYNNSEKEFFIQFFVPSKGKFLLRIIPNFFYIASERKTSEKTNGLCMALRKYLEGARLREIKQINSERAVDMLFEKENKYRLIAEIFSNGNLILCDENYKIINLAEKHTWKDRDLNAGKDYKAPSKGINFFDLKPEEIQKIFDSDKPLVKKLASDIGLGGIYAEEICILTGIDKNKSKIDKDEALLIAKSVKSIINKKINANIVYDGNTIIDIVPFELEYYKNKKIDKIERYNHAIDIVLKQDSLFDNEQTKAYDKKIDKINKLIESQEKKIEEIKDGILENGKIAEAIYNNYDTINEAITEINKASKKYSWQEIKDKLKNHKTIKEVNSKDKKVVLEL